MKVPLIITASDSMVIAIAVLRERNLSQQVVWVLLPDLESIISQKLAIYFLSLELNTVVSTRIGMNVEQRHSSEEVCSQTALSKVIGSL